jgi:hypothetical protein
MSRRKSTPALLALAVLAFSATRAEAAGFDLAWNACAADGGVSNRDFACDTDDGVHMLVVSCQLDQSLSTVVVVEGVLDLIVANGQPVPDWWDYNNCRVASLNADVTIDPAAVNCTDWSAGTAFGGILGYDETGSIALGDMASHRRIKVACTNPPPGGSVTANDNHFIFNVIIDNFSTVDMGGGNCPGCTLPVCIVLNSLRFTTFSPTTVIDVTTARVPGSNFATWQGGAGANCANVPVKQATWGAVKALYR